MERWISLQFLKFVNFNTQMAADCDTAFFLSLSHRRTILQACSTYPSVSGQAAKKLLLNFQLSRVIVWLWWRTLLNCVLFHWNLEIYLTLLGIEITTKCLSEFVWVMDMDGPPQMLQYTVKSCWCSCCSFSRPVLPFPLDVCNAESGVCRVRGCDDVMTVTLESGADGCTNTPSRWVMGGFFCWGRAVSLSHLHTSTKGQWISRRGLCSSLCPYMGSVWAGVVWQECWHIPRMFSGERERHVSNCKADYWSVNHFVLKQEKN